MIGLWYRRYILPASILAGTIIGAGVFSLPFVFTKAGWLLGFAYLAFFTAVIAALHLMFADVITRTEGEYRFVGYVRRYLGVPAFGAGIMTSVVGLLFTLTAYLVLGASFLRALLPGWGEAEATALFWVLGSLLVLMRIRLLAIFEFFVTLAILGIIGLLFSEGVGGIHKFSRLPLLNVESFFLPFGPVLFSLIGRTAIPSVVNYYRDAKESLAFLRRAVVGGTIIPSVFYAAFVVGIIGISASVSEDAITGLGGAASPLILGAVAVLGMFALLSTYVVLGIDVSKNLSLDLKFPRSLSVFSVIAAPMLFYAMGLNNFLFLVSIVGGIFVAIEGMMIVLMWRKVSVGQRYARVIAAVILAIFIAGIFYEIMNVLT